MSEKIQVTAFLYETPVFDRHGRPVYLGDTLRCQHRTVPYGQTRIDTMTVTQAHWQYGTHGFARCELDFSQKNPRSKAICYHKFVDYEHGHETWAEVVEKPERRP